MRYVRPLPIAAYVSALTLTTITAARADAALTARLDLVARESSVGVNEVLPIDVFLRDIRDTNVATPASIIGVDLDFGGLTSATSPVRFSATAEAPKAFVAGTAFTATLANAIDSSLIDGHTAGFADLSYTASFGAVSGIPSNSVDVFVGAVFASVDTAGDYTLSAANVATLVQSDTDNFDAFSLAFTDAAFAVTAVPEPAVGLAAVAAGGLMLHRRYRRTRRED